VSLTTAVRSIFRNAAKDFPGASEADIAVYAKLVFEAAATNLKSTYKDAEAIASANAELAEAAERGESWAVNLRDSVLVNVVKPIVDKATEKGVDPVPALVLQADVTEEQAREYVAALENRSTDADSADDTDEDEADDSADSDEGDSDSSTPVSYGYGSPVASA
jgi:hypothetical protein